MVRNYKDRQGIIHLGALGLEEGKAFEGLLSAGWATQIQTVCHPYMVVSRIVEEAATCLTCLAKSSPA